MLIYACDCLDVVLDLNGNDVLTELLEPLQKLLDQCKSAKILSRCVCDKFPFFLIVHPNVVTGNS